MNARFCLVTVLVMCLLAVTGCGSSGGSESGAPANPTATLTFASGELTPSPLKLPPGPEVDLVIVSADGLPHGVVVTAGGQRRRVVIQPGASTTVLLSGLQKGHSYRVVPDGATEPATLIAG